MQVKKKLLDLVRDKIRFKHYSYYYHPSVNKCIAARKMLTKSYGKIFL